MVNDISKRHLEDSTTKGTILTVDVSKRHLENTKTKGTITTFDVTIP